MPGKEQTPKLEKKTPRIESKPENLDASFEKANQILQEVYSVTISDELSSVTGDSAMSAEEKSRHEALVERCCEETPAGDKYRALFSHAPIKVLADHLDTLVNNGTVCALGVVYLRYS